jgi:hypothetical protein
MKHQFTPEEIRDLLKAAKVYAPGFSQNDFENLVELERHASQDGYLDAVGGLIRLRDEKHITPGGALDACKQAAEEAAKLEQQIQGSKTRLARLHADELQAVRALGERENALAKAQQDLTAVKEQCAVEGRKLEILSRRVEEENGRIEQGIEEARQAAGITAEEVAVAGQIKAEVDGQGVSLGLVLDVAKELAGQQDQRKKLIAGLEKHRSLQKYLAEVAATGDTQRGALNAAIAALQSQNKELRAERQFLTTYLSQLQMDVAYEDELRRFYQAFQPFFGLVAYMSSWEEVYMMRCHNPVFTVTGAFDPRAGHHRFWTDKPLSLCPFCGEQPAFDEAAYQALNLPVGASLRSILGK